MLLNNDYQVPYSLLASVQPAFWVNVPLLNEISPSGILKKPAVAAYRAE